MSKNYKRGPRNGGEPPGGWGQVLETVADVVETVREIVEAVVTPKPVEKPVAVAEVPPLAVESPPVEESPETPEPVVSTETQLEEEKPAEAPVSARKKR